MECLEISETSPFVRRFKTTEKVLASRPSRESGFVASPEITILADNVLALQIAVD